MGMFLKGRIISNSDNNNVSHDSRAVQAYSYHNGSALSVFGLAMIAAAGALLLVWATSSALTIAAEKGWIANPPELKQLVE